MVPKQRSRQPPTTHPQTLTNQKRLVSPATFTGPRATGLSPEPAWPPGGPSPLRVPETRAVSCCPPPPGKGTASSSAPAPRTQRRCRPRPPQTLAHQEMVSRPGRVTTTVSAAGEVGLGGAGQPLGSRAWPRLRAGPPGSLPTRASTSQASRQKPSGDLHLHVGEFLSPKWLMGGGPRAHTSLSITPGAAPLPVQQLPVRHALGTCYPRHCAGCLKPVTYVSEAAEYGLWSWTERKCKWKC